MCNVGVLRLAPFVALAVLGLSVAESARSSEREGNPQTCEAGESPDVIVGDLHEVRRWDRVDDITAFSVGTVSCNRGSCWLNWDEFTNQHPVIAQNMYRLRDGRFEQLGQSWLKHSFFALSDTLCFPDCQATDGTHLGVHCSDAYSAGLNGNQSYLGPRSQVNASTGSFPFPFSAPPAPQTIGRRIPVRNADLDPTLNPGAVYFVEGQYVTPDDASADNDDNNASYRRINVTGTDPTFDISLTATTQREQAAIRAWDDNEGGVTETDIHVPGDGLFILAARATDLGNGFWHYEYAVQNLNSDRSGGSFSVPIDPDAAVQNIGFHDVDSHSGEPYSITDWSGAAAGGTVTWSTTSYEFNSNSNALRWGTLYNFRFDADVPPAATTITLGLFKPGTPAAVTADTIGPLVAPPDCNTNGIEDACDLDCGTAGGPCDLPGCGGSADCDTNGTPDECQLDCDADDTPDGCEIDADGDRVTDDCDNCPADPNAGQGDEDDDGVGDACDPDYCRSTVFADEFETAVGWTEGDVGDDATAGFWTRVDPVGSIAQPEEDHSPLGTQCYVTGQGTVGGDPGASDVDGGKTTLLSPIFRLCGDADIGYWRWYSNATGPAANADVFTVDISSNGGASWVNVETVGPAGPEIAGGWYYHEFSVRDFVAPSEEMRVRFVASDLGSGSIVETAVDEFRVATSMCIDDCNSNSVPDACDLAAGTSADADLNGVPDECTTPAATLVSALSRKPHSAPPFNGDIAINVAGHVGTGGVTSEPRSGGITKLRLTFDVPPGQPAPGSLLVESQSCASPGFAPYSGGSTMSAAIEGDDLVLTFVPGLENIRTYRFTMLSPLTSLTQSLEVRCLLADPTSSGRVDAADRSAVVGAWTGIGFSVPTDFNLDGFTNSAERSTVVGVWTNPAANCAP